MHPAPQLIKVLALSLLMTRLAGSSAFAESQKDFQILSKSSQTVSKPVFDPGITPANAHPFKPADGSSVANIDPAPIHAETYAYRKESLDPQIKELNDNAKKFFSSERVKRLKFGADLNRKNLPEEKLSQELKDFRKAEKKRADKFRKDQSDALLDIMCEREDPKHPSDACKKRKIFSNALLAKIREITRLLVPGGIKE